MTKPVSLYSSYLAADSAARVNLEDLRDPLVADHLRCRVPEQLIEVGGRPEAAPKDQPAQPQVRTAQQELQRGHELLDEAFLRDSGKIPDFLNWAIGLAFATYGVDPRKVKVAAPYNMGQVCGGGFAMLRARGVKEHEVLGVDMVTLGRDLAECQRIQALGEVLGPAQEVLSANESVALGRVSTTVSEGLWRGESVIADNAELLRVLQPALAIRGQPARDAQGTRAKNERTEARTEAKLAASAPAPEAREPAPTRVVAEVPAPVAAQPKLTLKK